MKIDTVYRGFYKDDVVFNNLEYISGKLERTQKQIEKINQEKNKPEAKQEQKREQVSEARYKSEMEKKELARVEELRARSYSEELRERLKDGLKV